MKLSMWMIANRLSSLDLELEIDENAPATLNSARRAYATNCVYIYQSGDCVVCNGEGNIIRIRNMDETQAFEIVQGVFDYYEDWLNHLAAAARARDYPGLVDHAWKALQNPLILLDANNRVLGISRRYSTEEMDQEWNYLCKYGYSSLNSVKKMRYDYGNIDFNHHGLQIYHFDGSQQMFFGGASYCLYCNDIICGRINLLAKERPLNTGDYQLLSVIAGVLEPMLSQSYYQRSLHSNNVFYNVLFSKPYEESSLDIQLHYQQWDRNDVYQLALVSLHGDIGQDPAISMNIVLHTLSQQLPSCLVLRKNPYIILLSNREYDKVTGFQQFLQTFISNNPVCVGFSLPCRGIADIRYLYGQAQAAIRYGSLYAPESRSYRLFDYAIEYILTSGSFMDCVHACFPALTELWDSRKENNQEMIHTLKCYLDNERSLTKTSSLLFTHRNTILYRIKKIQELLGADLEQAYVRDYIRLSMRILELYQKTSQNGIQKTPVTD